MGQGGKNLTSGYQEPDTGTCSQLSAYNAQKQKYASFGYVENWILMHVQTSDYHFHS